jgi:hypothetical protein
MLREGPAIYVPITQDGKVVDSLGYVLDAEDDDDRRCLSLEVIQTSRVTSFAQVENRRR